MKAVLVSLFAVVSLAGQSWAGDPNEKYSPTKMEWLVLQLNVGNYNFPENPKPACHALLRQPKIICNVYGVKSQERGDGVRKIFQEKFDRHVKQLGIEGKVELKIEVHSDK